MLRHTIFVFGEAEKGDYCIPYICNTPQQLAQYFGNPPLGSRGIESALQALENKRDVIFFRVKEEGFSLEDYEIGLNVLQHNQILGKISAIHMPGVGNETVIKKILPLCDLHGSILVMDECDLFDYLLETKRPPHVGNNTL